MAKAKGRKPPAKKKAAKKKGAKKKYAPRKKKESSVGNVTTGSNHVSVVEQAWERGEGIECAPDESE